jgi:CubicO group peptidase (beta-lactamase class C family)
MKKWLLFVCLAFSLSLAAQKPDFKKLDAYLEQARIDWHSPGMAVGIVKDGKLVYAKGFGEKEIGKGDKPDANTLFAIASNSKAFTAAALALLVQEGKLSWDTKVRDILPYFELYDPVITNLVTIRDLLSHRVGIGTFSGDVVWYRSELTAEAIIKKAKHIEQDFEFRAGFGYSNVMYITAGEVIRVVSGQDWGAFVTARFLQPLGMQRSIYQLAQLEQKGNYATPHAYNEGKNSPIPWVSWETVAATGGLISSVNDLSKWLIFNMQHGIWQGDTLFTKSSRNQMWAVHNAFTPDQTASRKITSFSGYGLGWQLSDYKGHFRVSHTGGYDGMISAIQLFPDQQLGIIVLTNGLRAPIGALPNYIADVFLTGKTERDWSKEMLASREKREKADTRIADRRAARQMGTQPALSAEQLLGTYECKLYGKIEVVQQGEQLKLRFEHTPSYSCHLQHWHHDVYEMVWDEPQAWFEHATVQFEYDNNLKVTRLRFDVPNDDIFFDELNPIRQP